MSRVMPDTVPKVESINDVTCRRCFLTDLKLAVVPCGEARRNCVFHGAFESAGITSGGRWSGDAFPNGLNSPEPGRNDDIRH